MNLTILNEYCNKYETNRTNLLNVVEYYYNDMIRKDEKSLIQLLVDKTVELLNIEVLLYDDDLKDCKNYGILFSLLNMTTNINTVKYIRMILTSQSNSVLKNSDIYSILVSRCNNKLEGVKNE